MSKNSNKYLIIFIKASICSREKEIQNKIKTKT